MGRKDRGLELFQKKKIELVDDDDECRIFAVAGSGTEYEVKQEFGMWECDCPDFEYRHVNCKHIWACVKYCFENLNDESCGLILEEEEIVV